LVEAERTASAGVCLGCPGNDDGVSIRGETGIHGKPAFRGQAGDALSCLQVEEDEFAACDDDHFAFWIWRGVYDFSGLLPGVAGFRLPHAVKPDVSLNGAFQD